MRSRYSATSQQEEADVNMTPMLDIVFIMLIFFIVTTSFVKETGIEVIRPSADTAEQQEKANILIGIRENGEIWIDRRQVEVQAVRASVERMLAENPEAGVVVVADRAADTGTLIEAMDQARLAGASNISIAAENE
ncbi:ExbD/TolR family protein [Algiphilus aromaticivorans]|jgi:biopolymer transport protein ExbD|uniref:ExbD/TolR family protein n=1 Tax=Algiphilus aromaticivorans TaxID=382454 RepID=UPI0005C13DEC|nr:biopolymer transporter ExbD [Algiphilus aromaticivorans]